MRTADLMLRHAIIAISWHSACIGYRPSNRFGLWPMRSSRPEARKSNCSNRWGFASMQTLLEAMHPRFRRNLSQIIANSEFIPLQATQNNPRGVIAKHQSGIYQPG